MTESRSPSRRVIAVRPQPLTPEAFAPFGAVVDDGQTLLTSTEFPFFAQMMTLQPAGRHLRHINRHLDHTQLFATFGTEPVLLVVAPPDLPGDTFDPARIAAFVVDRQTAVVLHVGTWHTAPRALGATPVRILNVQVTPYDVHTELIDVEQATGCTVELELPR